MITGAEAAIRGLMFAGWRWRRSVETQQGKLGTMLAGGNGHPLYFFSGDSAPEQHQAAGWSC